jgi:ubiquinone/menaquinone biosynthesis C-methylase UbiE
MAMTNASATTCLNPVEGYRLWAHTYDHEANPMLSLERRVLEPLLPTVAGLDIIDLGCGTGRWLEVLKQSGARSLLGVDFSREMLEVAASKLGDAAQLVQGNCVGVPLADNSVDLVLCNFVLSYVEDPETLLKKVRGALRPGGSLFITDLHPGTAAALNWRRGAGSNEDFREIRTSRRAIEEVLSICEYADLQLRVRWEPRLGAPERHIFENNGKREYFDRIKQFPAIYVLQLSPVREHHPASVDSAAPRAMSALYGGRFVLGPHDSFHGEMKLAQ